MKKINFLEDAFVRQFSQNDCGIACLAMALNVSGHEYDLTTIQGCRNDKGGPISLLDLKKLAEQAGLPCKCVELDMDFLKGNDKPCILHVKNEFGEDHFEFCFGRVQKTGPAVFIMADPATYVYKINEQDLLKKWPSKAALYFNDMAITNRPRKEMPIATFLKQAHHPKALWISVPLINLVTTCLGITLTWILQKGISNSYANESERLLITLSAMLFSLGILRGLITIVNKSLLLKMNTNVSRELTVKLNKTIQNQSTGIGYVKSALAEIQKIENAYALLFGAFLPDAFLVLLILVGSFYFLPASGFIEFGFLLFIAALAVNQTPKLIYENARFAGLKGYKDDSLIALVGNNPLNRTNPNDRPDDVFFHEKVLRTANELMRAINRFSFFIEAAATAILVVVFSLGLQHLKTNLLDYSTFMAIVILCYFISSISLRIWGSWFQIYEGALAAVSFKRRCSQT